MRTGAAKPVNNTAIATDADLGHDVAISYLKGCNRFESVPPHFGIDEHVPSSFMIKPASVESVLQ